MADIYGNYQELSTTEPESHAIMVRDRATSVIIAIPHGGGIEPGTEELGEAIAGKEYSYYCFSGKGRGQGRLHIKSENFDEPKAIEMVKASRIAIALHGYEDTTDLIHVGGNNKKARQVMCEELNAAGFNANSNPPPKYAGEHEDNICNKCFEGGIQLELPSGLREMMFQKLSPRVKRCAKNRSPIFSKFVDAVCIAIERIEKTL